MRRTILLALALAAAGCGAPPPTGNGPVPVQNTNSAAPTTKPKVAAWPGVYDAKTGTFSLKTDSTWLASTLERVSSNGTIDTTATTYSGTWRATGTLLTLQPAFGTARIKGDTIFWYKGPRHAWEDSIKYTFVKK